MKMIVAVEKETDWKLEGQKEDLFPVGTRIPPIPQFPAPTRTSG